MSKIGGNSLRFEKPNQRLLSMRSFPNLSLPYLPLLAETSNYQILSIPITFYLVKKLTKYNIMSFRYSYEAILSYVTIYK